MITERMIKRVIKRHLSVKAIEKDNLVSQLKSIHAPILRLTPETIQGLMFIKSRVKNLMASYEVTNNKALIEKRLQSFIHNCNAIDSQKNTPTFAKRLPKMLQNLIVILESLEMLLEYS